MKEKLGERMRRGLGKGGSWVEVVNCPGRFDVNGGDGSNSAKELPLERKASRRYRRGMKGEKGGGRR